MNNYAKNFFRAISLLIIISSIAYIIHFRSMAISDLKEHNIQKNADVVSKLFIRDIWQTNSEVVSLINSVSLNELSKNPKFVDTAMKIFAFFKDLDITAVNIYTADKKKIISTNPFNIQDQEDFPDQMSLWDKINNNVDRLFILSSNNPNITQAINGTSSLAIIPRAIFRENNDATTVKKGAIIQVAIPIINNNSLNKVEGVIELFYNVDKEWEDLITFQNLTIAAVILIYFIFYGLFIYTANNAQKLIEKQQETNEELISAKAKAEADSKSKSEFLANISHELRTPLNAIIGFSEIIKAEALGPISQPEYKEYIIDINNSGSHLLSLINDILDFSKAEADKLQISAIEMDLTKILVTSIRFVQPRAEEASVKLVEELPSTSIVMVADPKRMKQAVLNLLSNSVKFTPENGTVTLSCWVDEEKKQVNIQVKDTGIGIADQDIAKAMSSFGQVDSKLSRKYEGTGLGLPLTKKLVELMNGKFDLKSELGFGTTITLTFPHNPTVS